MSNKEWSAMIVLLVVAFFAGFIGGATVKVVFTNNSLDSPTVDPMPQKATQAVSKKPNCIKDDTVKPQDSSGAMEKKELSIIQESEAIEPEVLAEEATVIRVEPESIIRKKEAVIQPESSKGRVIEDEPRPLIFKEESAIQPESATGRVVKD